MLLNLYSKSAVAQGIKQVILLPEDRWFDAWLLQSAFRIVQGQDT